MEEEIKNEERLTQAFDRINNSTSYDDFYNDSVYETNKNQKNILFARAEKYVNGIVTRCITKSANPTKSLRLELVCLANHINQKNIENREIYECAYELLKQKYVDYVNEQSALEVESTKTR